MRVDPSDYEIELALVGTRVYPVVRFRNELGHLLATCQFASATAAIRERDKASKGERMRVEMNALRAFLAVKARWIRTAPYDFVAVTLTGPGGEVEIACTLEQLRVLARSLATATEEAERAQNEHEASLTGEAS